MTASSTFLRRLRHQLHRTYQPEVDFAASVGVMHAAGLPRSEIVRRTGATGAEYDEAVRRLQIAAPHLEIPT